MPLQNRNPPHHIPPPCLIGHLPLTAKSSTPTWCGSHCSPGRLGLVLDAPSPPAERASYLSPTAACAENSGRRERAEKRWRNREVLGYKTGLAPWSSGYITWIASQTCDIQSSCRRPERGLRSDPQRRTPWQPGRRTLTIG